MHTIIAKSKHDLIVKTLISKSSYLSAHRTCFRPKEDNL